VDLYSDQENAAEHLRSTACIETETTSRTPYPIRDFVRKEGWRSKQDGAGDVQMGVSYIDGLVDKLFVVQFPFQC
jgi:hypothetical protein